MSSILIIVSRLLNLCMFMIVGVLIWLTSIYYSRIPEEATGDKSLIAWDVLMLIVLAISIAVKVVTP